MMRRFLVAIAAAVLCYGQQYTGPRPPQSDIPYLKHATNLVPTEAKEAKEDKRKNESIYTIEGAASTARTPLAMPIFLMKSDKIAPDRLELYRLEVKDGHREIVFSSKKGPAAIHMEVTKLGDNIFKLEVSDQDLEPGEYSLTPEGSNRVFCFQVY